MFADMVGSSALSTQLDPEEQREVIASFQSCCSSEIKRLGGTIAQYLGDGLLAYFGYPTAHEDDAERAIRAGLAIVESVAKTKLQARIGIASGVVVVGDLIREGVTQENAAIGETTNLAARLQNIAEPNTIIVSPETHRLVGTLFDFRDLGHHALKGFAPVHVRQVLGLSKVESRYEARQQSGKTPLLGREEELELLMRRWDQAKRGDGRVVLLTGEPGIGKSRLTRALQERLATEPHRVMSYYCSPYHQDSALYPVISQLTRAARIERDDDSQTKVRKLEHLLAQSSENLAQDMPLIAALLSVPSGDRYPLPNVTPQKMKERTLRALLDHLKKLAAMKPILMVFEDLHWIDPTSLELLSLSVEQIKGERLLMLVTARPEFVPPWPTHRHFSTVALSRLDKTEGEGLVTGVTGGRVLPAEVLNQILARTDGVPLFIEELTKTILESGILRDIGNRYELTGPLPPLAIPSTLHASLLARLDRLASVKDVAQIGAVIGREFSYALIAAVAALPARDLNAALAQLVDAELIFQRGVTPDAIYQFKHALVQDAAYASLVRSRRHQLHGQIARALREQFPESVATEPEILAHHFTGAGENEPASHYWAEAGRRSFGRSAYQEARELFERALHAIKTLPQTEKNLQFAIDIRLELRAALLALGDFARIEEILREAHQLATTFQDPIRLGQIANFLLIAAHVTGEHQKAMDVSGNGAPCANIGIQAVHQIYVGSNASALGKYSKAIQLLRAAITSLRGNLMRERFGQLVRPAIAARAVLAVYLAELGDFDEAIAIGTEAVEMAQPPEQPVALATALRGLGQAHLGRGNHRMAVPLLDRALQLCCDQQLPYYLHVAMPAAGAAYILGGMSAAAVELMETALRNDEKTRIRTFHAMTLAVLSEAVLIEGDVVRATYLAECALDVARTHHQRGHEAKIHRLLGQIASRRAPNDVDKASSHYSDALAAAAECGMRPIIAHCHLGLADLYTRVQRSPEAGEHLAKATSMFRDMGMGFWLKMAETQLSRKF